MNPILRIALPSIVSNITVPLLGLVDVAIVGHMGSAVYIGAVAVGSMIFSLMYWLFAFLRMGTSGLTAQAYGRRDTRAMQQTLLQSVAVAFAIAALLIVLQVPVGRIMMWLIGPTADVQPFAEAYFRIAIWGAPAVLCLYALTGWSVGMHNTGIPMVVSISQNIVNIAASLLLVYGLGMKIEGVAFGTVVAQYVGVAMAGILLNRRLVPFAFRRGWENTLSSSWKNAFAVTPFRSFFIVNRDIFLRTLCLVAVNLYFTSAGARQGAVILSVNAVMMQLYLFFSYFMDGFANAGEALGGRYYGAANLTAFRKTLRQLTGWAVAVTTVFTVAYLAGGQTIVGLLTDESEVADTATHYIFWAWLIPAAGATAFICDGIFIGITATRGMLVSSAIAALSFFAVYMTTAPTLGNHGLWLAQIVYLAMRGVVQIIWYKCFIHFDLSCNTR